MKKTKKVLLLVCLFILLISMNSYAREINSLDDLTPRDYVLIPLWLIAMLFLPHILLSDMEKEEKFFWIAVIGFLNIIGILIYYFKVIKKKD